MAWPMRPCKQRSCPYGAAPNHRSCCRDCHDTNGEHHWRRCDQLRYSDDGAEPARTIHGAEENVRNPEAMPERPAEPRDESKHLIVTLGFAGNRGKVLLRHWTQVGYRPIYGVDNVLQFIQDPQRDPLPDSESDSLSGTKVAAFARCPRVRNELVPMLMGRLLEHPVVFCACDTGKTFSVTVAEIVGQRFRACCPHLRVAVLHLEERGCSAEVWERLKALRRPDVMPS